MSTPVPDPPASLRLRLTLAAIGVVAVAALVALGVYTWQSMGDVPMDTDGYIALVLGVIGTVALGGGLMTLLFYSNRHGYDDAASGRGERRR